MTTLAELQKRAETLSKTRESLTDILRTLNAEIDTIKTGALPEIRRVARQIAKQHTELQQLIVANPALFEKPRTYVVDGLKFGLQKQKGALDWGDDEVLCERIHGLVAKGVLTEEQQGLLITTTEKPVAKALEKLDGATLKRLGITVGRDTDAALIKSVDGEIEKAVNAVIKDVTKDANAEVMA